MKLQSYSKPDCVAYAAAWEKATLDNLAAQTTADPNDAMGWSVFGKNAPDVYPPDCSPRKLGSWSISADGALTALADMAKRWNHTAVLQFLARIYTHALTVCPKWYQIFRTFPGEYAKLPPCWTWQEIIDENDKGDTDRWRHYGSLGLIRLGVDPAVRQFGNWSDDDVRALTDLHLADVSNALLGLGQGEFLRWSYQSEMLLGCSDVYAALGDQEKSDECWRAFKFSWDMRLGAADIWVHPLDARNEPRSLFTYGPMVLDSRGLNYERPWRYGWYPHGGGQSWYYGHVAQCLIQGALGAIARRDAFASRAAYWIRKIANWCDPRMRSTAPEAPFLSANDSVMMKNVLIHGGTAEADGPYITDQITPFDVAAYEALRSSDRYCRHAFADKYFFAVTGGVWDTIYEDPGGNKHRALKWSNGSYTPRPTSLDAVNADGLLSALWVKALLDNDQELTRYLEIWTAESMAYANSTDKVVSLSKAIDGGINQRGMNLVGKTGRLWSWKIKAGWEARAMMVGNQAPNGRASVDGMVTAMVSA